MPVIHLFLSGFPYLPPVSMEGVEEEMKSTTLIPFLVEVVVAHVTVMLV